MVLNIQILFQYILIHFYRFRTKYIPGVIGIIDGSQIGIFPPATNDNQFPEFIYVNRKGFHSINTQFVSIYSIINSIRYLIVILLFYR